MSWFALYACATTSEEDLELEDQAAFANAFHPLADFELLAVNEEFDEVEDSTAFASETTLNSMPQSFDLLSMQTPVRNQGTRGLCTFFATSALAESLAKKGGRTIDLSEQFLFWSTRQESTVDDRRDGGHVLLTGNSLNEKGTILESDWTYRLNAWTAAEDSMCTAQNPPLRCATAGDPTERMRTMPRFFGPRIQAMRMTRANMKNEIWANRQPVAVGLPIYSQAWSMIGGTLPRSLDAFRRGIVFHPTTADMQDSRPTHGDAHAFLVVGYDEALTLEVRDSGVVREETGFYLVKNSWGTNSHGLRNAKGAGYLWISMRYIEAMGTAFVARSAAPSPREICTDGIDNNGDGKSDCADSACTHVMYCTRARMTYSATKLLNVRIPDGDRQTGLQSEIVHNEVGPIESIRVWINNLNHDAGSQLRMYLQHGDATLPLSVHDPIFLNRSPYSGGPDWIGRESQGSYRLFLFDDVAGTVGRIESWTLEVTRSIADTNFESGPLNRSIAAGATRTETLRLTTGSDLQVAYARLNLRHANPSALAITVVAPDRRESRLEFLAEGGRIDAMVPLPLAWTGMNPNGTWTLRINNPTRTPAVLETWTLRTRTR